MASVSTTANYQGRMATLTVVESSYSITDNTSTLTWTLEVKGGSSNYYNAYEIKAVVDGETVYGPTTKSWDSQTFPAAKGTKTGTKVITHNADGSHADITFTIRGSFFNNNPSNNSNTLSLTTIPRASSVSIASSVTTNNSTTITVSPAVSSFSHNIYYSFGSTSWASIGTISAGNTTISWTPSRELARQLPNSEVSSSGAVTIHCETYNGSTYIGTKTTTTTLHVDSGLVPSLSSGNVGIQDGNSTVRGKSWGIYLQNMSYVNFTSITGSGSYGSSISRYYCTFEGTTYNSDSLSGLNSQIQAKGLPTTGSRSLSVWVKDSRGRTSSSISKSYTVVAYESPKINSYNAYRSNSSGTASDDGTYFKYTLNGSISSCNSKNAMTVNIRWKIKGASSDTGSNKPVNGSTSQSTYNTGATLGSGGITTNNTYEIIFEVSDSFTKNSRSIDIGPAFELVHYNANGYAVAFGKKSSATGSTKLFEVAMPSKFTQEINASNGLSATYIFSGGYMLKRKVIIDATSLSTSNFYPVLMQPGSDNSAEYALDCEVESTGRSSSHAWNQNYIHFRSHAGGWSDTPRNIIMDECKQFDSSEITIGAIGWGGSRSYKTCVWVRGGSSYTFITNAVNGPTLYTSDVWDPENASDCAKFTVGTNFYGGTNSNVEIPWVAGTQIDYTGVYNSSNVTLKGHLKNTNGLIYNDNNGVLTTIGAQNSGLTHYMTTASSGHYFNKQVLVNGDIYGGSSYNRRLAYYDELTGGFDTNTSGIWRIKHLFGNIYMEFGTYEWSGKIDSGWGNIYKSTDIQLPNFNWSFSSKPVVFYTTEVKDSAAYSAWAVSGNLRPSTTQPGKILLCRGPKESTSRTYYINIIAIGTM